MKAVLVLNGDPPSLSRLKELGREYPVFAADGGATVCMAAGVKPQWVAGDLDSLQLKSLPEGWQILHFPEQDRTDFQKVLGHLPKKFDEYLILGGLGRRTDHFLSNLLIVMALADPIRVIFEGEGQEIHRVTPATPFEKELVIGGKLSLIPLNRSGGVKTCGLKWNLSDTDMGPGLQLGQSNLIEESSVKIEVSQGCLFVWIEFAVHGQISLF